MLLFVECYVVIEDSSIVQKSQLPGISQEEYNGKLGILNTYSLISMLCFNAQYSSIFTKIGRIRMDEVQ